MQLLHICGTDACMGSIAEEIVARYGGVDTDRREGIARLARELEPEALSQLVRALPRQPPEVFSGCHNSDEWGDTTEFRRAATQLWTQAEAKHVPHAMRLEQCRQSAQGPLRRSFIVQMYLSATTQVMSILRDCGYTRGLVVSGLQEDTAALLLEVQTLQELTVCGKCAGLRTLSPAAMPELAALKVHSSAMPSSSAKERIIRDIAVLTHIGNLSITGCMLADEHVLTLEQALRELPALEQLQAGQCSLTGRSLVMLEPALQMCTRLHTLRLHQNHFHKGWCGHAMIRFIARLPPHLRELDLRRAFCPNVVENRFITIFWAQFSRLTALRSLDVRYSDSNHMVRGALALVRANSSLSCLRISGCGACEGGGGPLPLDAHDIAELLGRMPRLVELQIGHDDGLGFCWGRKQISTMSLVTSLKMPMSSVHAPLTQVASALAQLPLLVQLDISHNHNGIVAAAPALASALGTLIRLTVLAMSDVGLWKPGVMQRLVQGLSKLSNLVQFECCYNALDQSQVNLLAHALWFMRELKWVNVQYSGRFCCTRWLRDDGVKEKGDIWLEGLLRPGVQRGTEWSSVEGDSDSEWDE
jgi:hypothetical protein